MENRQQGLIKEALIDRKLRCKRLLRFVVGVMSLAIYYCRVEDSQVAPRNEGPALIRDLFEGIGGAPPDGAKHCVTKTD